MSELHAAHGQIEKLEERIGEYLLVFCRLLWLLGCSLDFCSV